MITGQLHTQTKLTRSSNYCTRSRYGAQLQGYQLAKVPSGRLRRLRIRYFSVLRIRPVAVRVIS